MPVELHDVQPHDPIGDITNDLLFSGRAMPHDVIGGVPRMLFIGDFVHHEKLAALIVETIVLAQMGIEFVRIAGENRFIGEPRDAGFDRRAQISVAQHHAHMHEIFKCRSRLLESLPL